MSAPAWPARPPPSSTGVPAPARRAGPDRAARATRLARGGASRSPTCRRHHGLVADVVAASRPVNYRRPRLKPQLAVREVRRLLGEAEPVLLVGHVPGALQRLEHDRHARPGHRVGGGQGAAVGDDRVGGALEEQGGRVGARVGPAPGSQPEIDTAGADLGRRVGGHEQRRHRAGRRAADSDAVRVEAQPARRGRAARPPLPARRRARPAPRARTAAAGWRCRRRPRPWPAAGSRSTPPRSRAARTRAPGRRRCPGAACRRGSRRRGSTPWPVGCARGRRRARRRPCPRCPSRRCRGGR